MSKIFLFKSVLKPGCYSASIDLSSDYDLDLMIECENLKFSIPSKIEYKSWYNEVSIDRVYKFIFNITDENLTTLSLIIKDNSAYNMKNFELYKEGKCIYSMINPLDTLLESQIDQGLDRNISKYKYPLVSNTFNHDEILALTKFLISGSQLTLGSKVHDFECEFAEYVGSKYAVMVNSGSSANLLMLAAITNFMFSNNLKPGDEVIIPVICWSTSVWPVIQCGLKPIFVDVTNTMNIDENAVENIITEKTKAIMLIHIMGNCCDIDKITKIANKYNLLIIEDTCEALGSSYKNKKLGTFGEFGTYSFYYSHHITTIEGGMVVTNSKENYNLLKCLRAHGWIRSFDHDDQLKYIEQYKDIDPRYMFINVGYNLRPMEMQGVMGSIQLKKLNQKNINRVTNYSIIKQKVLSKLDGKDYILFPVEQDESIVAWFGICVYLSEKVSYLKPDFLKYLESNGIENRPIVTGNFIKQPYFTMIDDNNNLSQLSFPIAEKFHNLGMYIGLSCEQYTDNESNILADLLCDFFKEV